MNGAIHAARFAGSFARALIPSAYALGYCMPPASRAGAAVLSKVEDWGRASTGPRLSPKLPDRSRPTALVINQAALPRLLCAFVVNHSTNSASSSASLMTFTPSERALSSLEPGSAPATT